MLTLLRLRGRIVGSVLLRESRTRFGRSRIGYLWALAEPIAHVAVMAVVYWALNRQAPVGASVIMFFVTGVLPFFLFHKVALHLGGAIRANQKLLRLPLIRPTDVLAARAMLEGVTWVAVTVVLFSGLVAAGLADMPQDPGVSALAAIATFGLGCGIGLINATLMVVWPSWVQIYPTLTRPLYHFSAIFFFVDYIPSYLQGWLSWNPLLHAVQWFRIGFRADYAAAILDRDYLLYWVAASLVIGLCLERVARRRLAYL